MAVSINVGLVASLFFNSMKLTPEANSASAGIITRGIAAGCLLVEGLGYFSMSSYSLIGLIVNRTDAKSRRKQILLRFIPTAVAMDFFLLMKWKRKIGTKEDEEKLWQLEKLKEASEVLPEEIKDQNPKPEEPQKPKQPKPDGKAVKTVRIQADPKKAK